MSGTSCARSKKRVPLLRALMQGGSNNSAYSHNAEGLSFELSTEGGVTLQSRNSLLLAMFSLVTGLGLSGCTNLAERIAKLEVQVERIEEVIDRNPDLVPAGTAILNESGQVIGTDFCQTILKDGKPALVVTVKNQGDHSVGIISYYRVTFFLPGESISSPDFATPHIGVGETVTGVGPVEIPAACLTGGCSFQITVDVRSDVFEFREDNNTVLGHCVF